MVKIIAVSDAPSGLEFKTVSNSQLLEKALEEANFIFSKGDCRGQIALNKHFFMNLPFPINTYSLVSHREAGTPVYPLSGSSGSSGSSSPVPHLAQLVSETLRQFQADDTRVQRANVIVREYSPGQHINFHVDDMKCENQVFGVILENLHPTGNGLQFMKGGDKKNSQLQYTVTEKPGACFCMQDQARYSWKHGLGPVSYRRISMTIRIFKKDIYEEHVTNRSLKIEQNHTAESTESDGNKGERDAGNDESETKTIPIPINFCLNRNVKIAKCAKISNQVKRKELLQMTKNKFSIKKGIKNARFYISPGRELKEGDKLEPEETIYILISSKEAYSGPTTSPTNSDPDESGKKPISALQKYPDIQKQYQIWERWNYPKLDFYCRQGTGEQLAEKQPPVVQCSNGLQELDELIQQSHLSVPEIRDLVFGLEDTVSKHSTRLKFGFQTDKSIDENRRTTSIFVILFEDDQIVEYLEFLVKGENPLKGKHKRDGPLWSLAGGLNNPRQTTSLRNKNTDTNKTKNKPKNSYQSKRGVTFTDQFLLFAGTTWPSSYYTCEMTIDDHMYTSVAQYVLSQQAKIFGDGKREEMLLQATHPSAPHEIFDHKAPKTGARQVKDFDPKIWEKHSWPLMWTGTLEKFRQNANLKHLLLETGDRVIVESTDDLVWGSGIALDHPDAVRPKKWLGDNKMGLLLMKIRSRLRSQD